VEFIQASEYVSMFLKTIRRRIIVSSTKRHIIYLVVDILFDAEAKEWDDTETIESSIPTLEGGTDHTVVAFMYGSPLVGTET
jgi:hypothetical protein